MSHRLSLFVAMTFMLGSATAIHAQTTDTKLIAKGQRQFLKCQSCHEIADNNIVKSGPRLKGVFGRKVASLEDYKYSDSLKSQTFTWDEKYLDTWLEQPTKLAPGTSMAFIGITVPDERKALIAYLKSVK